MHGPFRFNVLTQNGLEFLLSHPTHPEEWSPVEQPHFLKAPLGLGFGHCFMRS